jgi:hypothetical protein
MSDGLTLARGVVDRRQPPTSWPRAAAILLRQELEAELGRYWAAAGCPQMGDARLRHQLIALTSLAGDGGNLPAEIRHVWFRLTRASHGGTYELPPTGDQLLSWSATIERFAELVDGVKAA